MRYSQKCDNTLRTLLLSQQSDIHFYSDGENVSIETLTGNSWEKFINYRPSARNRTYACAMPVHCSDQFGTLSIQAYSSTGT